VNHSIAYPAVLLELDPASATMLRQRTTSKLTSLQTSEPLTLPILAGTNGGTAHRFGRILLHVHGFRFSGAKQQYVG
jgi:hypothetical protein